MMTSKITDQHLSRVACIYIRQSTPGQVRFNQESTERQYNRRRPSAGARRRSASSTGISVIPRRPIARTSTRWSAMW
jgi:hypothetical protein